MNRQLRQIVATTDVHSAFDPAAPMLTYLHAARPDSLIVDCGDFFEGSGFYRLGRGHIEREVLTTLYDLLAPGNHGWPHYFEPQLRRMTVCANTTDDSGNPLFDRVRIQAIGGRRVAVTGVMGPQAFNAIPASQRVGHHVTEPAQALREVMLEHHHRTDAWMVLSHSGFEEDLKLAAACPFADVIFAGHCHSDTLGPVHVGDTLVVKGRELGVGYAAAEPVGSGWAARTSAFPDASAVPHNLAALLEEISTIGQQLRSPIGAVDETRRNALLDRRRLLEEITGRLHTGLGADAVVLNETALRPVQLGTTLTLGDLLAIEPFGNQLVHAFLPEHHAQDLDKLLDHLTEHVGPLVVVAPAPLPSEIRTVLTTDYLADSYLGGRTHRAGIRLGQAVCRVLTASLPNSAESQEGGEQ
ncbi:metallophosphoesterase [Streptomyces sp. BPTC-684]|uniref:metallophosphoesterase n=1 Tax=Streptomyces sp. BPTC-684 TaxID=3043734 RepID=UPI0024B0C8D5|nr:metallophosphoesterase [Streptomyces sp. BPTC-684]WHM38255.1 metallophosphoesterase [Streptomyces sp. BPTC-684]